MLEIAGYTVKTTEEVNYNGSFYSFGPRIFIEPSFALTFDDLKKHYREFQEVDQAIEARTSVSLEKLIVNYKWIHCPKDKYAIKATNYVEGFKEFVPCDMNYDDEIYQIRGYKPNNQKPKLSVDFAFCQKPIPIKTAEEALGEDEKPAEEKKDN